MYYYRALPYDPVRPWKDYDGKWYSAWSTDGCNSTTKKVPCKLGGQLELLTSPALHGPNADWKQLEPMFTTPVTMSGKSKSANAIEREFVTASRSQFIGVHRELCSRTLLENSAREH